MNNETKAIVGFIVGAGVAIGLVIAKESLRRKIERARAAEEALQMEIEESE